MRDAIATRPASRRPHRRFLAVTATVLLGLASSLLASTLAPATAAAQERAWVRGEIRLNLRTGPGTQFRIVSGITTGDEVRVIERGDSWTQVRKLDGTEGWVPVGYLEPNPPPTIRLAELEAEVASLSMQLEETAQEAASLRKSSSAFSTIDSEQKAEIKRLTLDNMELRAGARWPEWLTGAGIIGVGMMLGALLHRSSTRPRSSRIRL